MFKRVLLSLCLVLVVCLAIGVTKVWADLGEMQDQYDEIWNRLEDVDWLMKQNEAEKQQAIAEAQKYLDQLNQVEGQLNLTQEQIDYVMAEMELIQTEYNRAVEDYDRLYKQAAIRLNINFQKRNNSSLDAILGCDSIMESLRMIFFGVQVSTEDVELLKRLEESKAELKIKHDLLYEDKLALSLQQAGDQASVEEIMALYQAAQDELRSIESMFLKLQQMEEDMLAESDKLAQLIKDAEEALKQEQAKPTATPVPQATATPKPSTPAQTSKFIWPCPDYPGISSYFGMRLHPIYNEWRMHNGIDINAADSTYILASASGKVIAAEWMEGYGYCVMISHSGGYTTLYAHCSKMLVTVGQQVTQGQKIALVGSTGWSTGPHLHFEVWVNDNRVDPLGYVSPPK